MYKTAPATESLKINVSLRLPLNIRDKMAQKAHAEMYRSLSAYLETIIIRHSTNEDFAGQLSERMDKAAGNIAEKVQELAKQSEAIKSAPAIITESVLDALGIAPGEQAKIMKAITEKAPNRQAIITDILAPLFAPYYPETEREMEPDELIEMQDKIQLLESTVNCLEDEFSLFENDYAKQLLEKFKDSTHDIEGEDLTIETLGDLYCVMSYKFFIQNVKN